ncbi:D-methionine transport system substrate-binding protein [Lacrimispora xylanisolvens]|uniref:D-methionine transport system substrate-binding protein n=1 Tax=Lacrimispora xylanisolvens TaxID=384636 RepID=A0A2S6HYS2_9FIRM|nr:MetQ/NlpA family ABC transporter substrate-binding protein [Hungatella xylanolytica]PPK83304.1 D-methionine transport system substrate-binding protein [Hungatella xylanolytica]
MRKLHKRLVTIAAGAILASSLSGCAGSKTAAPATKADQPETTTTQAESSKAETEAASEAAGAKDHPEIKYRRMPTATSDLFEAGIVPILEKKGYKFTPVEITDSVQREIALSEDEIDMHVDAHTAYINNFNKDQGTELTAVLAIPTVPTGIYSGSKDKLDNVADGDKIAFPNDASNEARSLQLLSEIGFITMNEGIEPTKYTLADIKENPHKLEFVEMKGGTIAGVRTDFAFIILRGSDAYNAGIDFGTALAAESQKDILPDNMMQIIVNGKHKDEAWVQDVKAAYQSEEFKEFIKTQSSFWILPDYLK